MAVSPDGGHVYVANVGNNTVSVLARTFTVAFDVNGGSGTAPADQTVEYGSTATRPTDPTRTGYTLTSWSTTADGSSGAFSFTTPITSGPTTLYAQWTAIAHTVTFDANGGTGTMADQSANAPTALVSNGFARSGFTFAGWNTEADGTGTAYADGAIYPFDTDTTLYAQWTAVSTQDPTPPPVPGETASAAPDELAATGANDVGPYLRGGVAALLAGAVLLLTAGLRRRHAR